VEHYCRQEWAVHLQDVMIRRTSWHHYWPEAPQMAAQVAGWMAGVLGWSAERTAGEIAAYQAICRTDRACCCDAAPL
jgi:glycerol-3-phosphate dehydrogenase